MEFHEKLDFLMRLTNTTNSALSLHVNLDASYVSRLRRGQRRAPKDVACLEAMAAYFAKVCKLEYQRKSLAEAMDTVAASDDGQEFPEKIAAWLREKNHENVQVVGDFLTGLSNFRADQELSASMGPGSPKHYPQTGISVYYGIEGKRRAALAFLAEVAAQNKAGTMLLFSDEPTDWMTGDPGFARQWADLMAEVLRKGNRIRIIHTVSRDLDEMLSAISQWLPLYMTGLMEPYFYPKKRDGIFRRTLFIAAEVSAVSSNSIGNSSVSAANFLFRDMAVIKALGEEFLQYLDQCKPLMRIYTARDKESYFHTLLEFEKEQCDALIKTESLSLLTMPPQLAMSIRARLGITDGGDVALAEERYGIFLRNIGESCFTELVSLFSAEEIRDHGVPLAFSEMLYGDTVYYTLSEYILHLEHILTLLKKYRNFHVQLVKETPPPSYMVYVREDTGVIVARIAKPPVVLAFNEANLTAAFWDYLRLLAAERAVRPWDDAETAKKLAAHIRRLKKSL